MIDRGSRFVAHAGSTASLLFWAAWLWLISWMPVYESHAVHMTEWDWTVEAAQRFGVMTALCGTATLLCFAWTTIYLFPLRFEWSRLAATWVAFTAATLLGGAAFLTYRFLELRPWF